MPEEYKQRKVSRPEFVIAEIDSNTLNIDLAKVVVNVFNESLDMFEDLLSQSADEPEAEISGMIASSFLDKMHDIAAYTDPAREEKVSSGWALLADTGNGLEFCDLDENDKVNFYQSRNDAMEVKKEKYKENASSEDFDPEYLNSMEIYYTERYYGGEEGNGVYAYETDSDGDVGMEVCFYVEKPE